MDIIEIGKLVGAFAAGLLVFALVRWWKSRLPSEFSSLRGIPLGPPMVRTTPRTKRQSVLSMSSITHVKLGGGGQLTSNELDGTPPYLKLPPNKVHVITVRPQAMAFRPERFAIESPEKWLVHDVRVGNRSQFVTGGSVPAEAFVGMELSMDTVQTAMDFSIHVQYTGQEAEGEPLKATCIGSSVDFYGIGL